MNSQKQKRSAFYVDSASLKEIRNLLAFQPALQRTLGIPARLNVVLDANLAIADLLHKLKAHGLRQTAIEKCARAGTLGSIS